MPTPALPPTDVLAALRSAVRANDAASLRNSLSEWLHHRSDEERFELLVSAIRANAFEAFDALVEQGADPQHEGSYALLLAVELQSLPWVERLLPLCAPNEDDHAALRAAAGGSLAIVQALVTVADRLNDRDSAALRVALEKRHADVAHFLIEQSVRRGEPIDGLALPVAASAGDVRLMQALWPHVPSSRDREWALYHAATGACSEVVRWIVEQGLSPAGPAREMIENGAWEGLDQLGLVVETALAAPWTKAHGVHLPLTCARLEAQTRQAQAVPQMPSRLRPTRPRS